MKIKMKIGNICTVLYVSNSSPSQSLETWKRNALDVFPIGIKIETGILYLLLVCITSNF